MKYPVFTAIFSAILSFTLLARADDRIERTEESFIPNFAVGSSYFTWTDDADFSDAPGSLSSSEYGVEINVPIMMKEGFRLTAGVKYRRNSLNFTGAPFPLGNTDFDLERVDIPFNVWKDINDSWKLWVRLQPGIYSDFNNVSSDDFILSSLALLSYQWTETTKVAFGAYYSRDLGEERVLPAIGFIFEPNQNLSLALTFPRVAIAYAPTPDWLFTGRALLNGAGWNISNPTGAGPDVDLNYRHVQVGIGVDRRITGPWWAYLDAGMQVAQEIEIEGAGINFQQDLDSAAFVTGGVRLRF